METLNCNFETSSLCNYRLIGAEEKYNNKRGIEGQYLEIKLNKMERIFLESPLIEIPENGHNFSFYHFYLSPYSKLNVYADDKLIYSYPNGFKKVFQESWKEAKFGLPVGKYKVKSFFL